MIWPRVMLALGCFLLLSAESCTASFTGRLPYRFLQDRQSSVLDFQLRIPRCDLEREVADGVIIEASPEGERVQDWVRAAFPDSMFIGCGTDETASYFQIPVELLVGEATGTGEGHIILRSTDETLLALEVPSTLREKILESAERAFEAGVTFAFPDDFDFYLVIANEDGQPLRLNLVGAGIEKSDEDTEEEGDWPGGGQVLPPGEARLKLNDVTVWRALRGLSAPILLKP
jgi:hypothetical protein